MTPPHPLGDRAREPKPDFPTTFDAMGFWGKGCDATSVDCARAGAGKTAEVGRRVDTEGTSPASQGARWQGRPCRSVPRGGVRTRGGCTRAHPHTTPPLQPPHAKGRELKCSQLLGAGVRFALVAAFTFRKSTPIRQAAMIGLRGGLDLCTAHGFSGTVVAAWRWRLHLL